MKMYYSRPTSCECEPNATARQFKICHRECADSFENGVGPITYEAVLNELKN